MVKMKRIGGLLAALLLAAGLMFSLTGCEGNQKAEKLYQVKVRAKLQEIQVAEDAVNAAAVALAASITEDTRRDAIAAVDALTALYDQLGEITVPKKYEELSKELLQAAQDAKQGCEVYRTEFTAVTDATFDSAFVERISAGDALLEQAGAVFDRAFDELAVSSNTSSPAS